MSRALDFFHWLMLAEPLPWYWRAGRVVAMVSYFVAGFFAVGTVLLACGPERAKEIWTGIEPRSD